MRTLSAVLILAVAAIATLTAHDHHGRHHRGVHHSNYCGTDGCGSDCRGSNCGQQSNTAAMRSAPAPIEDMQVIHFLFDQHSQVTRRVNFTDDGIEAITESADPTVRAQLRKHVRAMKQRLDQRQPLRQWDPLFAAIFEHAGKIRLDVFDTPNGVRIVETSSDPSVVKIIHAHAHAVSGFVTEGGANMHKSHPVPATGSR